MIMSGRNFVLFAASRLLSDVSLGQRAVTNWRRSVQIHRRLRFRARRMFGFGGCAPQGLRLIVLLSLFVPPAFAVDCLIEPTQTIELASPVTGLLDKVLVKRADRVAKGQIVATLESRAEHAAAELARFKSEQIGPTAMAENKIEFAKRKFSRRQAMTHEKLMPAQDRDDAEAELRLAESELKVATENRQLAKLEYQQQSSLLNLRTVRSPFDGVVVDQLAYPGEVVEPGSSKKAIVKLAQLDPLRVHVVLPKDAFAHLLC